MIDPEALRDYFPLAASELRQLSALFSPLRLDAGEPLLRQGSYHPRLAFVHMGYLRVHADVAGRDVTQWIVSPRSLVTDLAALLYRQPARFTITALTDCELASISATEYQDLVRTLPGWLAAERSFLVHCFVTLEQRVQSFLSLSARQRYDRLFAEQPELFNRVPLQYLASMLGMTPETLSRIRSERAS